MPEPVDQWGGRRCKAFKSNSPGEQCKAMAVGGEDYCNFHSMEPEELKRRQILGGKNSKQWFHKSEIPGLKLTSEALTEEIMNMPLETPDDVKKLLGATMKAVAAGHLPNEKAQMMAYLSNVLLAAMRTAHATPQAGDGVVLPEIKEIERSSDARAESETHPGSEFGRENAS